MGSDEKAAQWNTEGRTWAAGRRRTEEGCAISTREHFLFKRCVEIGRAALGGRGLLITGRIEAKSRKISVQGWCVWGRNNGKRVR